MICCSNCKSLNNYESTVCEFCGASLIYNNFSAPNTAPNTAQNINSNPNNNYNQNVQNRPVYVNQIANSQVQYSYQPGSNGNLQILYDMTSLADSFMVKNVVKLRKGGFSWSALLMGPLYAWYRKMYKLFGIWSGIIIALTLILGLFNQIIPAAIAAFIVSLVIGVKFKDMYKNHAYNKADEIKNQNYGKSQQELNEICAKKGGVNVIPLIIYTFYTIILVIEVLVVSMVVVTTIMSIDDEKVTAYANEGRHAIEAVKKDVYRNNYNNANCSRNDCIYDKEKINSLLTRKLETSPFGQGYRDARVKIISTGSNSYKFSVCLIDSSGKGFGYVDEKELASKEILRKRMIVNLSPAFCW